MRCVKLSWTITRITTGKVCHRVCHHAPSLGLLVLAVRTGLDRLFAVSSVDGHSTRGGRQTPARSSLQDSSKKHQPLCAPKPSKYNRQKHLMGGKDGKLSCWRKRLLLRARREGQTSAQTARAQAYSAARMVRMWTANLAQLARPRCHSSFLLQPQISEGPVCTSGGGAGVNTVAVAGSVAAAAQDQA